MKTQEFLSLLANNTNKSLVFEYAPNQLVGANYHITELMLRTKSLNFVYEC